jgi:hypothetical protein
MVMRRAFLTIRRTGAEEAAWAAKKSRAATNAIRVLKALDMILDTAQRVRTQ